MTVTQPAPSAVISAAPFAGHATLFAQLLFIFFLGQVDAQMLSPLLPTLAADFGVSVATVGTAVTAYAVPAALWALVVGPLSDRFGRLIFLRVAAALMAAAALLAFFAPAFEIYLGARLLAGVAGGTISACVISQVADLFSYGQRGRAMGWLGAVYFVSAVIGVPAGAWLADRWGWRAIYLMLALAAAPLIFLFRQKTVQNIRAHERTLRGMLQRQGRDYLRYWRTASTRNGLLLALTFSATAAGLLTYLGAWLSSRFGMSLSAIGLVFLVTGLASTVGAFSGGWLSDRAGKRMLIAASSLALALILPLLAGVSATLPLYLMISAGGVALAMREGPFQALITELVPAQERGAFIALRNATSQIAIAASVAICGALYANFGFMAVTLFAAALSLAAAALVVMIEEPKL